MQQVEVKAIGANGAPVTLWLSVDPRSCIDQVWVARWYGAGCLQISGAQLGLVAVVMCPPGSEVVIAPNNPSVGYPYFRVNAGDLTRALGYGVLGRVVFETKAAPSEWRRLDGDAGEQVQGELKTAEVTACGATVTYRIRAGEREHEASASGVDPGEIESALRALRRALSGAA